MGKMRCKCDYTFVDQKDHYPWKYDLVKSETITRIIEMLDDKKSDSTVNMAELFCDMLLEGSVSIYICPECNILHKQEGKTNLFKRYIEEINTPSKI